VKKGLSSNLTLLAIAAAAAAAAVSAASTVLASGPGSAGPVDPLAQIDAASAREVLAFDASWGRRISTWVAPTPDGRLCTFFQEGDASASRPPFGSGTGRGIGGFCPADAATVSPGSTNLVVMFSFVRRGGGFSVLVRGATSPGSRIAAVRLEGAAGAIDTFTSADGRFIGEIPMLAGSADALPTGGPYAVVGYDSAGQEVERSSLDEMMMRE
jgi:hypothetical protein